MISWMLALVPGVVAAKPAPPEPDPELEQMRAERDALKAEVERAWKTLEARDVEILDLRRHLDVLSTSLDAYRRRSAQWAMPTEQPPMTMALEAERERMRALICTCTPGRSDVLRRQFYPRKLGE